MKISAVKILELNEQYHLVQNLSKRELENPEGSGLDLRVGEVYHLKGDSFLGADETERERYSPETELIASVEKDGHKTITLHPGDYVLVRTIEIISAPDRKIKYDPNLPEAYLIPKIHPRVSLQKGGVDLLCTKTDPGYVGQLVVGLSNVGGQDFKFELGARMFNLEYEAVSGEIKRAYSGQHQGGRVSSEGQNETQN